MKTELSDVTRRPRTGLPRDPYYEWTAATRFAYYGKAKWFPILIQLAEISPQKFAQGSWYPAGQAEQWNEILKVPSGYAAALSGLQSITFVTALVKKRFLARLQDGHPILRDVVRRYELGRPVTVNTKKGSEQATVKKKSSKEASKIAISAVIDDGLAFAHKRFRLKDQKSTRIEYFWDQMEPNPNPEPNWDYGREIDKRDPASGIDRRLRDCERAGLVDEDDLYRAAGHVDHAVPGHKAAAWRASHGTHVMDLACGSNPAKPPKDNPVIAVQLPGLTTADTSGATLAPQVIDALHYILYRANSIAEQWKCGHLPVVVNLSYGTFAGPHDGSSMLERAIDELIVARRREHNVPLEVVVPSGNSHLSRCHACFCLGIGGERILHWRVQPDDATESILEIWLPHTLPGETGPSVEVQVRSPSGDARSGIIEGTEVDCLDASGRVIGKAAYYAPGEIYAQGEIARRPLIRITLAPTVSHDRAVSTAPSGTWLIALKNIGSSRIHDIHAWIERDDTPYGYPRRGRQSRFEDPDYVRFDHGGRELETDSDSGYVRRHGSINGIATGVQTIVIGGYRRSDWKPPNYTAGGPIVNPPGVAAYRDGPDALAPSEDSVTCHGVLAAGARSGSSVAMVGTSMAAPLVARWVARRIRSSPLPMPADPAVPLYRNAVRARARNEEGTDGANRSPQPPAMRGGEGRIKLDPVAPAPPLKRHAK